MDGIDTLDAQRGGRQIGEITHLPRDVGLIEARGDRLYLAGLTGTTATANAAGDVSIRCGAFG